MLGYIRFLYSRCQLMSSLLQGSSEGWRKQSYEDWRAGDYSIVKTATFATPQNRSKPKEPNGDRISHTPTLIRVRKSNTSLRHAVECLLERMSRQNGACGIPAKNINRLASSSMKGIKLPIEDLISFPQECGLGKE